MDQKVFNVKATTAAKFLESMPQRWQKPATVFCSRDLENGLNEFVKAEMEKGSVPSDDALRAKAREILGMERTSADEVELLEKFKALHGISSTIIQPSVSESVPTFDDAMLAELNRVGAATASPLRRRASEKMAAQAGFTVPRQF
jgi:hypothetical protein